MCRYLATAYTFPDHTSCRMTVRYVLYYSRMCPRRSPCNHHCLQQICTCSLSTLCMFLCRRRHRSLRCKCRRHEHCSEEASSSSGYRPCRTLQRFVLQRSRTCPRRSPCNHHCLLQICTCLLRTLHSFSPRCWHCPSSLRCKRRLPRLHFQQMNRNTSDTIHMSNLLRLLLFQNMFLDYIRRMSRPLLL